MQSALITTIISIALITWLPDAARAMRGTMLGVAAELHEAVDDGPLAQVMDGGN